MRNKEFFVLLKSTMTSTINEIYGVSTLTQTYFNNSTNSLEVKMAMPLSKESILHKLTIQLEDKTVYARIKEREKAEEQSADSMASGNFGITGNYSQDDDQLFELAIFHLRKSSLS